jgi:hypothetical protein
MGFLARKPVQGPEFELVQLFVRHLNEDQGQVNTRAIAVFYEPHVGGCFPDLVVAEYDSEVFQNWSNARSVINTTDVRILNHLHRVGQAAIGEIDRYLGYSRRSLERSLEHLEGANLAVETDNGWAPLPLEEVFGIQRLVAIEAKVEDWRRAFRQADSHRHFASECFVLLPPRRNPGRLFDMEKHAHIGILFCDDHKLEEVRQSQRTKLPVSHVSWMFNEWIGRSLQSSQIQREWND